MISTLLILTGQIAGVSNVIEIDYSPYFNKYPIQHHWYNKDGLILAETEYKNLLTYLTKWYTTNSRNNLIFKINDTSNTHHFAKTGGIRAKDISSILTSSIGTFNLDNSVNIVLDSTDSLGSDIFHSSGALRVIPTTTEFGLLSSTGGIYGEII